MRTTVRATIRPPRTNLVINRRPSRTTRLPARTAIHRPAGTNKSGENGQGNDPSSTGTSPAINRRPRTTRPGRKRGNSGPVERTRMGTTVRATIRPPNKPGDQQSENDQAGGQSGNPSGRNEQGWRRTVRATIRPPQTNPAINRRPSPTTRLAARAAIHRPVPTRMGTTVRATTRRPVSRAIRNRRPRRPAGAKGRLQSSRNRQGWEQRSG